MALQDQHNEHVWAYYAHLFGLWIEDIGNETFHSALVNRRHRMMADVAEDLLGYQAP
jgi:hypothetical protein